MILTRMHRSVTETNTKLDIYTVIALELQLIKLSVQGSSSRVYFLLYCAVGPEGNQDRSYLSFFSEGGLLFGIINVVGEQLNK